MTVIRGYKRHLVQFGTAWGTWTDYPDLECLAAEEGAGTVVGSASFRWRAGLIRQPNVSGGPVPVSALAGLGGQYVRVLIASPTGTIIAQSTTWDALWHGVMRATVTPDEGGGRSEQILCADGLAIVLDGFQVLAGWSRRQGASGGGPSNLVRNGRCIPFQEGGKGNRSAAKQTVNAYYTTAYVWDRYTQDQPPTWTPAADWTAFQALETLLALWSRGQNDPTYSYTTPLEWRLSDPDALLTWVPDETDPHGCSLLTMVSLFINARRGLTWKHSVAGNVVTIRPYATNPSAISQGPYTLPASTYTATVDLSTSHFLDSVQTNEDCGQVADIIRIEGDRPWVAMTIVYAPGSFSGAKALKAGWGAGEASVTDKLTRYMRRWMLNEAWVGNQWNGAASGLRSATDGTGARTYDAGQSYQVQDLELTKDTPAPMGFTLLTGATEGPRQPAMAWLWDTTQYIPVAGFGGTQVESDLILPLDVETIPGAITLADGEIDRDFLADLFASNPNARIHVTLGVREPTPLWVEWQRPSAQWARDTPRIKVIQAPKLQQHLVLDGTASGILADYSDLTTVSGDKVIRDDSAKAHQALALARAYYGVPGVAVSWFDAGVIDYGDTLAPCRLLTSATLSTGTVTPNATMTRRRWQLTIDDFGTGYSTERQLDPLEIIR